MIKNILEDFKEFHVKPSAIIITHNIPEDTSIDPGAYSFPVKLINNKDAQGFGANHNAAFAASISDFFCVLNPDVRLDMNPFPTLLEALHSANVGIVAPIVFNAGGAVEDSARYFITPGQLVRRLFSKNAGIIPELLQPEHSALLYPDWVAGICMMFLADTFKAIRGFDEGFHLYYEDVDICARTQIKGYNVALCPKSRIIHLAQKKRFRDLRHLAWHISSAARYFRSDVYKTIRNGPHLHCHVPS